MELTKDNILSMEPGIKMDILISVKLFGYKESNHIDGWIEIGNLSTYPKQYSTKMFAVWEVVENMRSRGYDMTLRMFAGGNYQAMFGLDVKIEAFGWSAPYVICKAALLAYIEFTESIAD